MLISLILIASLLSTGTAMLVSGLASATAVQTDVASQQEPEPGASAESDARVLLSDLALDDTLDLPSLPPRLAASRPSCDLPVHEAAGYDIGLSFEHRPPIA
ncbi:hypothetical protein HF319_08445 [Xanthomonas sp. Kuri4-1]